MKKASPEKKAYVKKLCEEGIVKANEILSHLKEGEFYQELSRGALINIKNELKEMSLILDKKQYDLAYPRFILDYPKTDLIDYYVNIWYEYYKKT